MGCVQTKNQSPNRPGQPPQTQTHTKIKQKRPSINTELQACDLTILAKQLPKSAPHKCRQSNYLKYQAPVNDPENTTDENYIGKQLLQIGGGSYELQGDREDRVLKVPKVTYPVVDMNIHNIEKEYHSHPS